jgi:hypothetical protein
MTRPLRLRDMCECGTMRAPAPRCSSSAVSPDLIEVAANVPVPAPAKAGVQPRNLGTLPKRLQSGPAYAGEREGCPQRARPYPAPARFVDGGGRVTPYPVRGDGTEVIGIA